VGYLVTDSLSGTTQTIVDQIRTMPETIRLRVIH
jgi:D-3-phosphoglycerate dehydrogenase